MAVISDLHADEGVESRHTRILSDATDYAMGVDPLVDLLAFVESAELRVDYVLAPGDVANQGNAVGLPYAWRRLNDVATKLGADVIGTPGNHDVTTHQPTADIARALKALTPSFPVRDQRSSDFFWDRGYLLLDREDHRILVIDSTKGFPHHPDKFDSDAARVDYYSAIDRGYFLESVEKQIRDDLALCNGNKVNIALVHHHPVEHQLRTYLQDSYGPMHRGGELVKLLTETPTLGRWVVVHGHKHIPLLSRSTAVSAEGPLILCAGSLGAKMWEPVANVTKNQFHILDASNLYVPGAGTIRGVVESYTWSYGIGWTVSDRLGSGLPAVGGFGCTKDPDELMREIASLFSEGRGRTNFLYADIVRQLPELQFQLPLDQEALEKKLEDNYDIIFTRDRQNRIYNISKRVGAR
ncbi:hypothetical protein GCM10009619_39720 [Williamsia maris]